MTRTRHTAPNCGVEPIFDELLVERHLGSRENKRYDKMEIQKGGEDKDAFSNRVRSAINAVLHSHTSSNGTPTDSIHPIQSPGNTNPDTKASHVVLITHGLFIQSALQYLSMFASDANQLFRVPISNTGISTLIIESKSGNGAAAYKVRPLCLNKVEHLTGLKRQRGGIGSLASDPKQARVSDFFRKA